MSALSVSVSWPTTFARVLLVAARRRQRHLDLLGAFDDVVVRQDVAGLVDDEAGAGALGQLSLGVAAAAAGVRRGAWLPARSAAEEARSRSSPP